MKNKFILLGDCHQGCRNDHPLFYLYADKFYQDMFRYIDENQIDTVFQLGDLFDRRKYVNFRTLAEARKMFFDPLKERGITMHTLVGNHDLFLRESTAISSSDLLLGEYDNIIVHDQPTTLNYNGTIIDIIPWICAENKQQIMDMIEQSTSDLCFGHFEMKNFSMFRGMEAHDGLEWSIFEKYEHVFSGHYHTRSTKGNITYVGTPYEMCWSDWNDPKGFTVFDLNTRQTEFVVNPHIVYVRLEYNEDTPIDLKTTDLKDKIVKLVGINKIDLYRYDQFVQQIRDAGCYELKIVDNMLEYGAGQVDDDINLEDTMDVLGNYIDSIETDADKSAIKNFMKGLYLEAINTHTVD